MSKYLLLFPAVLILFLLLSDCGGSDSSGGSSGSSGDVEQTAVNLPEFPKDATVTQPEEIEINGQTVPADKNNELDDTDADSTYVAVTFPLSLARAVDTNINAAFLWLNDTVSEIQFTVTENNVVAGSLVPLKNGDNYFLIFVTTTDGGKFRTPIIKVTRVDDDGIDTSNSLIGKWRMKKYSISVGTDSETTEYFPIYYNEEGFTFLAEEYEEFTATTSRYYYYEKADYDEAIYGEEVEDSLIFEYCSDDDSTYVISGNKLIFDDGSGEASFQLSGDILSFSFVYDNVKYEEVYIRDDTLDFSTAVNNCYYRSRESVQKRYHMK